MAKLIQINKLLFEMHDNVQCDHCGISIIDTEYYSDKGYIFWCNECVDADYGSLDTVLKSIDDKFQFLPEVYFDTSQSTITYFGGRYNFSLIKNKKKHRYYWWGSGEYINKIKAIPKAMPKDSATHIGMMMRESSNGQYQWHAPKESSERIKADHIIVINEPFKFTVRWSDGTIDTFVDGVRQ